jgi:hypothetical protein
MTKRKNTFRIDLMDHPSGTATGLWPGPRRRPCGCGECQLERFRLSEQMDAESPPPARPNAWFTLSLN